MFYSEPTKLLKMNQNVKQIYFRLNYICRILKNETGSWSITSATTNSERITNVHKNYKTVHKCIYFPT